MLKKSLSFGGLYALLVAVTALIVWWSRGDLWDDRLGWGELGGIFAVLLVITAIVGGLYFAVFGKFSASEGWVVIGVGTLIVLIIGTVGLIWLADPLKTLFASATFGWLVAVLVVTTIVWWWPRPRG